MAPNEPKHVRSSSLENHTSSFVRLPVRAVPYLYDFRFLQLPILISILPQFYPTVSLLKAAAAGNGRVERCRAARREARVPRRLVAQLEMFWGTCFSGFHASASRGFGPKYDKNQGETEENPFRRGQKASDFYPSPPRLQIRFASHSACNLENKICTHPNSPDSQYRIQSKMGTNTLLPVPPHRGELRLESRIREGESGEFAARLGESGNVVSGLLGEEEWPDAECGEVERAPTTTSPLRDVTNGVMVSVVTCTIW